MLVIAAHHSKHVNSNTFSVGMPTNKQLYNLPFVQDTMLNIEVNPDVIEQAVQIYGSAER